MTPGAIELTSTPGPRPPCRSPWSARSLRPWTRRRQRIAGCRPSPQATRRSRSGRTRGAPCSAERPGSRGTERPRGVDREHARLLLVGHLDGWDGLAGDAGAAHEDVEPSELSLDLSTAASRSPEFVTSP